MKIKKVIRIALLITLIPSLAIFAEIPAKKSPKSVVTEARKILQPVKPPLMGWSSWNNYHVAINESIIRSQADAMATNGMADVGYTYINIDDGFFGGRTKDGSLMAHPTRFPNGMKALTDYIHSKGLKAGIYSDAGINTCGCHGDADTISVGCGLMGHEREDLTLMLKNWNFDFIKVDWCGAIRMGLDEQVRYTEIGKIAHEIKPDVVYNICRWQFPGKWVTAIADSWRISGDILDRFESIAHIIDLNADLWPFCGPGHYNDMDMLQVGRGMNYEEDKAHFSMWCMMCSPLLAGNDLTNMKKETLDILTNKEVIALNQDPLFYQARRFADDGDHEVWAKPLIHTMSGEVAVALFNRSKEASNMTFYLSTVGLDAGKGYIMRDLWEKKNYASSTESTRTFLVPAHGIVVLRIKGTALKYNPFQYK